MSCGVRSRARWFFQGRAASTDLAFRSARKHQSFGNSINSGWLWTVQGKLWELWCCITCQKKLWNAWIVCFFFLCGIKLCSCYNTYVTVWKMKGASWCSLKTAGICGFRPSHIMVQSNTSLVCLNLFQERKKGPGTNESADGEEHHWPCKSHFDVPTSTSPSLTTYTYNTYIYIYTIV